jgi:hypothetical protein
MGSKMGMAVNRNTYFWLLNDELHFCPQASVVVKKEGAKSGSIATT